MPRGKAPSPQSNRTDQLSPAPVTAMPDQTYGVAAEQRAAQGSIPIANGPTMPAAQAPQTPGAPAPSGTPQGAPGPNDILAMAQAHNGPGIQPFLRPTERPGEPVTHGIPGGPGAGPEALTGVGAAAREGSVEQGTLKNLLQNLSSQPNATTSVKALAALAGAGQM